MSRRVPAVLWTLPGVGVAAVVAIAAASAAKAHPAHAVLARGVSPQAGALVGLVAARPAEAPPLGRCAAEPPPAGDPPELPASTIELVKMVREQPERLGSASMGPPNHGRLWGALRLEASADIEPSGDHPWGTVGVVRSIERAAREVRRCFPESPRLHVGDISRKEGGWLKPHRSHQAGLDADIGYFYRGGEAWFEIATEGNLDRGRTWALVRALIEGGNVESMFIDRSIQRMLRQHAESLGDAERVAGPDGLLDLDRIFEGAKPRHDAIIHHASGHASHFHVRFHDVAAEALGARLAAMVPKRPATPATPSRATPPRAAVRQAAPAKAP